MKIQLPFNSRVEILLFEKIDTTHPCDRMWRIIGAQYNNGEYVDSINGGYASSFHHPHHEITEDVIEAVQKQGVVTDAKTATVEATAIPVPEPTPLPKPEPVSNTVSETEVQSKEEPKPTPEPVSEPSPEPTPQPEPEPTPAPKTIPVVLTQAAQRSSHRKTSVKTTLDREMTCPSIKDEHQRKTKTIDEMTEQEINSQVWE